MKSRVHFIAKPLMNAMNPIMVNVHGAGGTGSHLMPCLARMNFALQKTGRAGLQVRLFDADQVEQPNLGRGGFNENYLGVNKAVAVINHINRSFGLNWKAYPEPMIYVEGDLKANLNICCVDSVASRKQVIDAVSAMKAGIRFEQRDEPLYLMDFGNAKDVGQVLLSTVTQVLQPSSEMFETVDTLPALFEEFPDMEAMEDQDSPSCSVFEALNKQSLFVNSVIANLGASLLYQALNEGMTMTRGFFMNLETLRTEPIKV